MRGLLIGFALVASLGSAAAEDLCPEVARQPVAEGTRMTEDTFEVPAGLDAADKLQAYLNQEKLDYDFNQVLNSVVAKGVILRQQALVARTALELVKARNAGKDEVDKAEVAARKGLEAFCAFMVNAVVAD